MDTTRKRVALVNRGDLIQTSDGFVIADTWSAAPGGSADGETVPVGFWYDTDGGRHFPNPTDSTLTVRVPTFRTHDHGVDRKGVAHALLNPVPGKLPQGYCEGARDAGSDLSVWSSGTALSAVTCQDCRRGIGLVNSLRGERERKSTGI